MPGIDELIGLGSLGSKLLGKQQVGPAAPDLRSNLGGGNPLSEMLAALAQKNNFGQLAAGMNPASPLSSAITPPASAILGTGGMGPPQTPPNPLLGAGGVGPPQLPEPEPESGGFGEALGGFFGGLDNTLQSPSKVLGLGLLSQINPNLGLAGLFAGGLLGRR